MDIFVLENKQNNISGSSSTSTNIIMMEEISPSLQKMSFRRWKPEQRKKYGAKILQLQDNLRFSQLH